MSSDICFGSAAWRRVIFCLHDLPLIVLCHCRIHLFSLNTLNFSSYLTWTGCGSQKVSLLVLDFFNNWGKIPLNILRVYLRNALWCLPSSRGRIFFSDIFYSVPLLPVKSLLDPEHLYILIQMKNILISQIYFKTFLDINRILPQLT